MIKNFLNIVSDAFYSIIEERKILIFSLIFLISGFFIGLFFTSSFSLYATFLLSKNLFKCICFLLFQFLATTIICIILARTKGAFIFVFSVIFLRGLLFSFTLKYLFCNYSILASFLSSIIFLVIEIVILIKICLILIYYCRHNISVFCDFNLFFSFLALFDILLLFIILLVLFLILRPFLFVV